MLNEEGEIDRSLSHRDARRFEQSVSVRRRKEAISEINLSIVEVEIELVEVEIELVEEGRSWCLAMDENEASWSLCDGWKWSSRMDENEVRGKFWERKGNEVIKLIKEGYYWKDI